MLTLHTVFDHPEDFPSHWVVRRFYVAGKEAPQPAPVACLYDSLEQARRDLIRQQLYRLVREPGDVPCIVETWV